MGVNTEKRTENDPRSALSPSELADRWGCCRATIFNMLRDGELKGFKVRNSRLIRMSEIERIEAGKDS